MDINGHRLTVFRYRLLSKHLMPTPLRPKSPRNHVSRKEYSKKLCHAVGRRRDPLQHNMKLGSTLQVEVLHKQCVCLEVLDPPSLGQTHKRLVVDIDQHLCELQGIGVSLTEMQQQVVHRVHLLADDTIMSRKLILQTRTRNGPKPSLVTPPMRMHPSPHRSERL